MSRLNSSKNKGILIGLNFGLMILMKIRRKIKIQEKVKQEFMKVKK